MHYTFEPEEKHAKAYGRNARISAKRAAFLCKVIRRKPLKRAKRLMEDLISRRRSLSGKYYTKAAAEMLSLLKSCEKNAAAQGLDTEHLMVHASAHQGTNLRRRRRKQSFGTKMKSTNVEIMLSERIPHDYVKKSLMGKDARKEEKTEEGMKEIREGSERLREKSEELEKEVEEIVGKDIPTHADKRKRDTDL